MRMEDRKSVYSQATQCDGVAVSHCVFGEVSAGR